MAGHSKWANIQHRKGRQDEKRGKVWTRIIREIMVAARQGGGDPNMNPRLRLAIDKAKAANMPADTVKKNIDKATGNLEGVHYEEIRYEGYGIGGAAIIVDCMTDNRVRTVAEVRHAFSKYGGNLGTEGSVAFQFKHCGQTRVCPRRERRQGHGGGTRSGSRRCGHWRRRLHRGAECARRASRRCANALAQAAGLKPEWPRSPCAPTTALSWPATTRRMQKLLDMLEDLDDVQDVFHNAEL
jgi:transcriptional/translational regulatory protein YebC/TACO1